MPTPPTEENLPAKPGDENLDLTSVQLFEGLRAAAEKEWDSSKPLGFNEAVFWQSAELILSLQAEITRLHSYINRIEPMLNTRLCAEGSPGWSYSIE